MYSLLWLNITKMFANESIHNTCYYCHCHHHCINIAVVNGLGERAKRSSYSSPKTLDCLYVPVPPCPCCVSMPARVGRPGAFNAVTSAFVWWRCVALCLALLLRSPCHGGRPTVQYPARCPRWPKGSSTSMEKPCRKVPPSATGRWSSFPARPATMCLALRPCAAGTAPGRSPARTPSANQVSPRPPRSEVSARSLSCSGAESGKGVEWCWDEHEEG